MKVKQTVKIFSLLLVLAVGLVATVSPVASAAVCGGVETSIIQCDQGGTCTDGTAPFEGNEPLTDAEKTSYRTQHGHDYGKCANGAEPDKSVEGSGVWGVLLLAINILTAGIGIAAVGGIIYGAILYTSAGGSQEQTKKAIGIITNVVIGVIAYALMFAALNFLIPGGVFR